MVSTILKYRAGCNPASPIYLIIYIIINLYTIKACDRGFVSTSSYLLKMDYLGQSKTISFVT